MEFIKHVSFKDEDEYDERSTTAQMDDESINSDFQDDSEISLMTSLTDDALENSLHKDMEADYYVELINAFMRYYNNKYNKKKIY